MVLGLGLGIDSNLQAWLYPAAVVLGAYFVLGVTGFGSALVAVPLLSWRWPLLEVVPVVLTMDALGSALHGRLNWKLVQWSEFKSLLPGMLLGVGLGVVLARVLNSQIPLMVLGAYVALVGINALRSVPPKTVDPLAPVVQHTSANRAGFGVGILVGIIEVMFGTAGPPVVAWLTKRLDNIQNVRATTPVMLVFASLVALVGLAFEGRVGNALYWQRLGVLVGLSLLAVWAGHVLAHRLPAQRLRQAICGLLVLSGLALIARALAS